jgi:nucleoside-diphosphate-sugar epimerase
LVDATAAVLAALEAPPGVYNVADPVTSTNRQLNDVLAAITRRGPSTPLHLSYSAADRDLLQRSHGLDDCAFRTVTGWNPRFGPSALAFVPST